MSAFLVTKNIDLNLKDLNARNQSIRYSSTFAYASLLLFTCTSVQTVSRDFGADKFNSSAFSSSNTDHDFNIPKNIDIYELFKLERILII